MTPTAIVVSPNPGSDAGGTERVANLLAELLTRRGYETRVIGPSSEVPRQVARFGFEYAWQARAVRRQAPPVDLVISTGHLGWPGRWGSLRVHTYPATLAAMGWAVPQGNWRDRVRKTVGGGLADVLGARGAQVVTCSGQVADEVRMVYGVQVAAVIPSGVDTEIFRPRDRLAARARLGLDPNRRYGLFPSRPEPGKHPAVAYEACWRNGFELLSAGTRGTPGARPLGALSREELAWAYSAADAVIFPTSYEGFPFVTLEALACGIPVVTSPAGWKGELSRAIPEYKLLVSRPEPLRFSMALARTASREAVEATAAAHREVVRNYNLEKFCGRWNHFLDDIGAPRA
jgi:glycosyltransferase involved in cell wall biosynthesis